MPRLALALAVLALPGWLSADAGGAAISCRDLVGTAPLIWRLDELAIAKAAIASDAPRLRVAYNALIDDAQAALRRGPYSVVHKTRTPPSGDRHDYMSMAPYWWPPAAGGAYVRRDGEVNPERDGDGFDRTRLRHFIDDVTTLSLAAFLSDEPRYAQHAAVLLRVWFVDDATRMNPNLNYGQGVPGRSDGRQYGIIDTTRLVEVIDALQLLRQVDGADARIVDGMRAWFDDYVRWLTTSELGLAERAARNNHGTHYDAQLMTFALFAGRCALAQRVLDDTRLRIGAQIQADGFMPHEIERTRALHYHAFNLQAFLTLARLAEHFGENLYAFAPPAGGAIVNSVSMLAGYLGRASAWPHPNQGSGAETKVWQVLRMAATALDSPALRDAIRRADSHHSADRTLLLTASIDTTVADR